MQFVYGRKLLLVPIKEMVQALSIRKQSVELKRGQWVRIKRGIYKGDLAQVLATGDQHTSITIKLIPRLDLPKIARDSEVCFFE